MKLAHNVTDEDVAEFLKQSEEKLQLLDEDLVLLEAYQDNPGYLEEAFRLINALSEAAEAIGHQRMCELSRAMINVLSGVRDSEIQVTTHTIDTVLQGLDVLNSLRDEIASEDAPEIDIAGTIAELEEVFANKGRAPISSPHKTDERPQGQERDSWQAATKYRNTYRVKVAFASSVESESGQWREVIDVLSDFGDVLESTPSPDNDDGEQQVWELQVIISMDENEDELRDILDAIDNVESIEISSHVPLERLLSAHHSQPTSADDSAPKWSADASLTSLTDIVGEILIDRRALSRIAESLDTGYRDNEQTSDVVSTPRRIAANIEVLEEAANAVRLTPLASITTELSDMALDLARTLNKQVDIVIDVGDTQIERVTADSIREVLSHLLSNAIEHGIDPPEQRGEADKSEMGSVRLTARSEQNHVVITVSDDGVGLDPDGIRSAAVNSGSLSSDIANLLSDVEAVELAMLPGISTDEDSPERGEGLSIVKSNVESMGGVLNIETSEGQGSEFTITLPLLPLTLQSLLVTAGRLTFALPLGYLVEAVARSENEITLNDTITVRGVDIPIFDMRKALAEDWQSRTPADTAWIVTVRLRDRLIGLAVDSLIGFQEVAVKRNIGSSSNVKGISAVGVWGDGNFAPILDVVAIVNEFSPSITV